MRYVLLSAIADDTVTFAAPSPLIAALVVLQLGWPCIGARPIVKGKPDPTQDINGAPYMLRMFLKRAGAEPPLRAMRLNRAAVIAAIESVRRDGPPPTGLIDIAKRAREWAAILRAASAPVSHMREAAE